MSAALLAQGPGERTKVQGFSDAGKAALSKQIADAVSRGDTPGVVEIVVNREGTLYLGSAGKFDVAKNVPMPTNAIFQIASMTKPVTSVAIMMLLEQGKLKLDDPVSKYLPGYDNLQVITHFNEADATLRDAAGEDDDDHPAPAGRTSRASATGSPTRSRTPSRPRRRRASGSSRSSTIPARSGTTRPARASSASSSKK